MRWLTFIMGGLAMLTLQSAVAVRVELFGARPDWLLVLVVFYAMHARAPEAAVGSWMIGVCADLMTVERVGLMAASYLAAALLVISIREYFFRFRSITQFGLTLVTCLLVRTSWCVYRWLLYEPGHTIPVDFAIDVVLASLYTAGWAPPLHKVMLAISPKLGIHRPRYTYAGLDRMRDVRV